MTSTRSLRSQDRKAALLDVPARFDAGISQAARFRDELSELKGADDGQLFFLVCNWLQRLPAHQTPLVAREYVEYCPVDDSGFRDLVPRPATLAASSGPAPTAHPSSQDVAAVGARVAQQLVSSTLFSGMQVVAGQFWTEPEDRLLAYYIRQVATESGAAFAVSSRRNYVPLLSKDGPFRNRSASSLTNRARVLYNKRLFADLPNVYSNVIATKGATRSRHTDPVAPAPAVQPAGNERLVKKNGKTFNWMAYGHSEPKQPLPANVHVPPSSVAQPDHGQQTTSPSAKSSRGARHSAAHWSDEELEILYVYMRNYESRFGVQPWTAYRYFEPVAHLIPKHSVPQIHVCGHKLLKSKYPQFRLRPDPRSSTETSSEVNGDSKVESSPSPSKPAAVPEEPEAKETAESSSSSSKGKPLLTAAQREELKKKVQEASDKTHGINRGPWTQKELNILITFMRDTEKKEGKKSWNDVFQFIPVFESLKFRTPQAILSKGWNLNNDGKIRIERPPTRLRHRNRSDVKRKIANDIAIISGKQKRNTSGAPLPDDSSEPVKKSARLTRSGRVASDSGHINSGDEERGQAEPNLSRRQVLMMKKAAAAKAAADAAEASSASSSQPDLSKLPRPVVVPASEYQSPVMARAAAKAAASAPPPGKLLRSSKEKKRTRVSQPSRALAYQGDSAGARQSQAKPVVATLSHPAPFASLNLPNGPKMYSSQPGNSGVYGSTQLRPPATFAAGTMPVGGAAAMPGIKPAVGAGPLPVLPAVPPAGQLTGHVTDEFLSGQQQLSQHLMLQLRNSQHLLPPAQYQKLLFQQQLLIRQHQLLMQQRQAQLQQQQQLQFAQKKSVSQNSPQQQNQTEGRGSLQRQANALLQSAVSPASHSQQSFASVPGSEMSISAPVAQHPMYAYQANATATAHPAVGQHHQRMLWNQQLLAQQRQQQQQLFQQQQLYQQQQAQRQAQQQLLQQRQQQNQLLQLQRTLQPQRTAPAPAPTPALQGSRPPPLAGSQLTSSNYSSPSLDPPVKYQEGSGGSRALKMATSALAAAVAATPAVAPSSSQRQAKQSLSNNYSSTGSAISPSAAKLIDQTPVFVPK